MREAGISEHTEFEYVVMDGGAEELTFLGSGREHSYSVWGGLLAGLQGSFDERLSGGEVKRALAVLRRVRAEVEGPLSANLVNGAFRGFQPDAQRRGR